MIPKVLHYVWLKDTPLPDSYKRLQDIAVAVFSDWDVRLWDESACKVNAHILRQLPSEARSFKSDLIRYEVLMEHGGVYTDFDVLWREPVDSLLHLSGFAGYESNNILCNAVIGAEPWAPFMCDIVSGIDEAFRVYSHPSRSMGVRYFTECVNRHATRVSRLPKVAFHRLHGHRDVPPEYAAKATPGEFATHMYHDAFSRVFIDSVLSFHDKELSHGE